jgi:hypothetical protein
VVEAGDALGQVPESDLADGRLLDADRDGERDRVGTVSLPSEPLLGRTPQPSTASGHDMPAFSRV